jgi:hypothetical protein
MYVTILFHKHTVHLHAWIYFFYNLKLCLINVLGYERQKAYLVKK